MVRKTIADGIEEDAIAGIARVTVDGTTTEGMSMDDRIKAAEYGKKATAAAKNHLGITFRTLVPGGTGGSNA